MSEPNVEGQAASSLAWTGLFGVFSETDMMMIDSDVKWIMVNDLGASASGLDLGIGKDWPMTGEQQWRRDQGHLPECLRSVECEPPSSLSETQDLQLTHFVTYQPVQGQIPHVEHRNP